MPSSGEETPFITLSSACAEQEHRKCKYDACRCECHTAKPKWTPLRAVLAAVNAHDHSAGTDHCLVCTLEGISRMRAALERAEAFIADELEHRQESFLPDPEPMETGYISEAEDVLTTIRAALAKARGEK